MLLRNGHECPGRSSHSGIRHQPRRLRQEPIHIPGAIQPHGAVLAARLEDLLVTHVSANLADILGVPPDAALGHPLSATLGEAACGVLRDKSTQSHPGHVDSLA